MTHLSSTAIGSSRNTVFYVTRTKNGYYIEVYVIKFHGYFLQKASKKHFREKQNRVCQKVKVHQKSAVQQSDQGTCLTYTIFHHQ